jgi:hypothetical protein
MISATLVSYAEQREQANKQSINQSIKQASKQTSSFVFNTMNMDEVF